MIHMRIITRRIIFDDGNKVTITRGQSFALDLVVVAVATGGQDLADSAVLP